MSEHHLDRPQIRAPLEQVRGERVAQHVRADAASQAGFGRVGGQAFPETHPTESGAARVDEQIRHGPAADKDRPAFLLVAAKPDASLIANRYDALLAAFARTGQVAGRQVHVGRAQADQLRDTQAGGVEDFQQRPIAQATRRVHIGLHQQGVHFLRRQTSWQGRPWPGAAQIVGRAGREPMLEDLVAEKPAHAGDHAGHRSWREAFRQQASHESFKVVTGQVRDIVAAARGKAGESSKVPCVAFHGVARQAPFDAEMIEILVHQARSRFRVSPR